MSGGMRFPENAPPPRTGRPQGPIRASPAMASRSEENSPYGRLDEEVEPRHVGKRLDTVLAELTQKSRSYVASLIKSGKAGIKNRIRVAPSTKLKPGDRIFAEWRLSEPPIEAHPIELSVAYEDEDLAVVEKPAGIAVHPGAGSEDLTLASALLARWPEIRGVGDPSRPGIVHRLDADVSGLLIVARRREAYDCLVRDFSARAVERKYLALVSGRLEADIGRIEGPIGRDPSDPTKRAVVLGGKPAATTYTRLAVWSGVTLAEVGLETGRTHQIRVHMQAIGHPIVGDPYYGGGSAPSPC